MSAEPEPLWRQNIFLSSCGFKDCGRKFTPEHRGQICTGCRLLSYCDSKCQRLAWSDHKISCRDNKKAREGLPSGPRDRPQVKQDLSHWLSLASNAIEVAARSAMKLGQIDAIDESHFLMFDLKYQVPPKERWGLTSDKPLGDERGMFKYTEFRVWPDSCLDENLPELHLARMGSAQKKAACKPLKRPGLSTVFVLFQSTMRNGSKDEQDIIGTVMSVPHFDPSFREIPPFEYRLLNDSWRELLIIANGLPVPKNEKEAKEEERKLVLHDVALSETLERLSLAPLYPPGGWKEYQAKLREQVRAVKF